MPEHSPKRTPRQSEKQERTFEIYYLPGLSHIKTL
jgi:hypothetical protein